MKTPLSSTQIPIDIIAGLSLVAVAIPQALAYTNIAGTPVITGLYTIFIPPILFALFGSSRHLVVGADSATAAVMASGLMGIGLSGSSEYATYASLLAIMAGLMLLIAGMINLGFLSDFLSRTVLIGFLTGVGFQLAVGQIPDILGIHRSVGWIGHPIRGLVNDIKQITEINLYTLSLSIAIFIVIVSMKKISKKIPASLIAVIVSIIISFFLNLTDYGVNIIGDIPKGFPSLAFPLNGITWSLFEKLVPIAFSLVIVIVAQSAATSRAYATYFREIVDENRNLTALGIANIGSGLSGGFIANGTPTETHVAASSGARSQIAQITSATVVMIVLLFLTRPLAYLPTAVLGVLVFLIGIELINIKGLRKIYQQSPSEFWVAIITASIVFFVGVQQAILMAIVLSLIDHTRLGYRPKNNLLMMDDAGNKHPVSIEKRAQILPGLMIYRFNHSMYYANANNFSTEVLDLVNHADPPIVWFCLDAIAIDHVDFSAAETLREIDEILKLKHIRFVFVGVEESVKYALYRYDLVERFGSDAFFKTIQDVEIAYKERK